METTDRTRELVKEIVETGEILNAMLLLLLELNNQVEECEKGRNEYRAALNAIRKLNRNSMKKSVQEAIDTLCGIDTKVEEINE